MEDAAANATENNLLATNECCDIAPDTTAVDKPVDVHRQLAVSYTHLTLPTILRV